MLNEFGSSPVSIGQVSPSQEHRDIWHLLSPWLALLPRATYGMCQGNRLAFQSLICIEVGRYRGAFCCYSRLTSLLKTDGRGFVLQQLIQHLSPLQNPLRALSDNSQTSLLLIQGVCSQRLNHKLSRNASISMIGFSHFLCCDLSRPVSTFTRYCFKPSPCARLVPLSPAPHRAAQNKSDSSIPVPSGATFPARSR